MYTYINLTELFAILMSTRPHKSRPVPKKTRCRPQVSHRRQRS